MWGRIAEVVIGTLTVLALYTNHVRGEPVQACATPVDVITNVGEAPKYDLTGDALTKFMDKLDEQPGPPRPDGADRLLVFSHGDDDHDRFAFIVLFTHGCFYSRVFVPLSSFLEIYKGIKS